MLLEFCWGCCGDSPILPWEAADSTLSGLGWKCPLESSFSHTETSWRCVQFAPSLQEGCRSCLFICINLFSLPPFPLSEPFPSLSWGRRRTSSWGRCWAQHSFGDEFCFFSCRVAGPGAVTGMGELEQPCTLPGTVTPASRRSPGLGQGPGPADVPPVLHLAVDWQ